jgi:quinol---cytochrome c reductase cytochrome c subunit, bacillus type
VNNREKERYLREYSLLKSQGKPFFPYAVTKDSLMASIVLLVIIVMSLVLGAELGPKADPTTTTYTPRPEWYFFFLFELLRVVKPPFLVFVATVGIPTICMALLILLPFIDRNPERHPLRRPIATSAGILTIIAMTYLTMEGALAGPPTQIDLKTTAQYEHGKSVVASVGCLGCHRLGENGNTGPGPNLTHIGSKAGRSAIARTLINPTAPMPSFSRLKEQNPKQFEELVDYLGSLK